MSKRYIITILAVCMMATAFGKAPEKDAVYKLISKSYTLNTDGSTEFRKRTELQIFTRMTFDHFGETFITYNPDFQELIINEAYTIRKDGSKVETPANAFNPMLPDGCTKCERLNGIRTMVVTHTALEYDARLWNTMPSSSSTTPSAPRTSSSKSCWKRWICRRRCRWRSMLSV